MRKEDIQIVIITGLSGAGKSQAIKSFEDMGFFCIDNLPPSLMPAFVESCYDLDGEINKIAIVIDIRVRGFFETIYHYLKQIKNMGFSYEIVFLEASEEVLIRRFKETRRSHPLSPDGRITESIEEEKERLKRLREEADLVIDTSFLSPKELNLYITDVYRNKKSVQMSINIISFGFKNGIPLDADFVFDVRFLKNPYYIAELRQKTGQDKEVYDYVFQFEESQQFIDKLMDLIRFLIPRFIREDKKNLVIAIGCTGGQHRSVAVAERIYRELEGAEYPVLLQHRDITKTGGGGILE